MKIAILFFLLYSVQIFSTELTSWYDLIEYDTDTKVLSTHLKEKISKEVKVVGFIVPLTDDLEFDKIKEFYLVPDPMMCIHVPPPPPNQMIYVKMNKAIDLNIDFEGVYITGQLKALDKEFEYGDPGFELQGTHAVACDDYPFDEFLDPLLELNIENY